MSDSSILHPIQNATGAWVSFDWKSKLLTVEQSIKESKDSKEQSLAARKLLTETTKQFKRSVKTAEQVTTALSSDPTTSPQAVKAFEALAKECKVTVKSYQEEINNLTKRCKASESAHALLGQAMQEMPDPAAVLAAASEHLIAQQKQMTQLLATVEQVNNELQAQEKVNQNYKREIAVLQNSHKPSQGSSMSKEDREELVQLRREVAEYEVEFRSLKNQDITIRKLEARIEELQTAGQEQMTSQLEKAREELAETEGRRAADALDREAAMERKVQTLELQLKAERAGREATQTHMLEADEGLSQREAAWEAQRKILVDDSERVREAFQTATRERDELRLRVAALEGRNKSKTGPTPPPSGAISLADVILERKAYEAEVAELSETVGVLRLEIKEKEEILEDIKRSSQVQVEKLEKKIVSLNTNLASLEMQVASAPSEALVDSMKRELRILKRLEYNADDVDAERDPEIAGGNEGDEKDLETVLVAKLRKAESDLVRERVGKTEIAFQCDALKEELAKAAAAKEESDKLVAALEADLEKAIISSTSTPKPARKQMDVKPSEENPAALQTLLDPDAPPPSPPPQPPAPVRSQSASEKADDDHSVATIVMAQRDRLRARCESLEAERDSFKRELQVQVQSSESLKSDNAKLYEKVRYLQNYNKAPANRGAYNRGGIADRDLDLEALEQRYEASVDPFKQFSRSERQRKLNEMPPIEKTVYIVAKTFLSTKEMRTGLFVYVVALHLLVFMTTSTWSHSRGCAMSMVGNEHLAHLPPTLPAHVQEQMAQKAAEASSVV